MKSSDFLGTLKDLVSNISSREQDSAVNVYPAKKRFVAVEVPTADKADSNQQTPLDTMVPPLQQKLELLKRAVDIDNVFDGTSVDKDATDDEDYKQEIQSITKNAGISPVVLDALGDDEPLDN